MAAELFIARLPSLSNVEVFEAELKTLQSPFLQHLKSRCRELARSESGLLVSPTTAALHCPPYSSRPPMTLWIMARAGYLGSEKLQGKLKNLGIKVLRRVPVSEGVLQTCYQFSLTARLAPKWNFLSCWLVQGLEFLSTGRSHAVVLDVGVTRTEITLSVRVSRITFNFLQPSDLEVSVSTLGAFLTDPSAVITETTIYQNRCILMPNLTVGYVFSASHHLPGSPGFPTYDAIRLHWKKQHGMILPDKQALFFQIFFKSNSRTFFSYPGCCALKAPPTVVPGSRNSHTVACSFISDLHSRMPSLCGEAIRYSSKSLSPFPLLHSAASPAGAYPNLRPTPGPSHLSSVRRSLISHASAALASGHVTPHNGNHSGHVTGHVTSHSANHSGHVTSLQTVPVNGGSGVHSYNSSSRQCITPSNTRPMGESTGTANNTRIVPIFRPTQCSSQHSSTPQPTAKKAAPIVPSFKTSRTSTRPQTVPTYPADNGPRKTLGNERRIVGATPRQQISGQKRISSELSLHPPLPQKQCRTNTTHHGSTGSGRVGPDSSVNRGQHNSLQKRVCSSVRSSEQTVPDISLALTDTHPHSVSLHLQHTTNGPTVKKGKGAKKAAVQLEGVSGDTLIKISKVKVPLLKKWLQENGVKCSGRKTKDELVKMAAEHIRDTGTVFTAPS